MDEKERWCLLLRVFQGLTAWRQVARDLRDILDSRALPDLPSVSTPVVDQWFIEKCMVPMLGHISYPDGRLKEHGEYGWMNFTAPSSSSPKTAEWRSSHNAGTDSAARHRSPKIPLQGGARRTGPKMSKRRGLERMKAGQFHRIRRSLALFLSYCCLGRALRSQHLLMRLVHVIEGKPRRRLAVLVEGDCSASMTMARGEINGILAEQFSRPKGIITAPS